MDHESLTIEQREREIERCRRLGEAAEALIANIRSRPGMDRFLLPPTFLSLIQSLPKGFVIFLNVSKLGHHALVLNGSAKSAHSLPLNLPARLVDTKRKPSKQTPLKTRYQNYGITGEDWEQNVTLSEEEDQLRAGGVRERATFEDSLADLWVFIFEPIIIEFLQLKVYISMLRTRSS
jgi:hypothetical protein